MLDGDENGSGHVKGAARVSKRVVVMAQVFTLLVIVYILLDMAIASLFKDYLYYTGFPIFFALYVVPAVMLLVLLVVYLKKTFKIKFGHRHGRFLPFDDDEGIRLTDAFFGDDVISLDATPDLRPELAKVHGDLITGKEEVTLPVIGEYLKITKPGYLIGCGDVISKNLLKLKKKPDLLVIDGKTCRGDYDFALPPSYFRVEVKNKAGGITRQAWFAIKLALKSGRKTIIEVMDGEEDLLVIPLVLFSRVGTIVAYGQPPVTDHHPPIPAGAVMVQVKRSTKNRFENLLRRFKVNR
ncbi:MAG: DUF359 domain-containing protein [Promethearchaeota archaeon]